MNLDPNATPRFSVIIPAFNRPEMLAVCLEKIAASTLKPLEIIVVDDASPSSLQSVADKFGTRFQQLEENSGPAYARNVGASLARGEILVFIDSDVGIRENTFELLIHEFADPLKKVVQGVYSIHSLRPGLGAHIVASKLSFLDKKFRDADYVHSQVFAIRKKSFDEYGGFDPSFRPPGGGEEFEFGHRIRKHTTIHTLFNIEVDHFHVGFFGRGRLLFHRAFAWSALLLQSKRFEKSNASTAASVSGLTTLLSLIFALLGIFVPISFLASLLCLVIATTANFAYLKFAWQTGNRTLLPLYLVASLYQDACAVLGGGLGLIAHTVSGIARALYGLRFRFSNLPTQVILFVTARCNAKCGHCFYWKEIAGADKSKELSLEEIDKIASRFGHIKLLSLTGGEPTLRRDLPEIIQIFRKRNGIDHVSLHTNGLRTTDIVQQVRAIAFKNRDVEVNIAVSIDGCRETHDRLRGIDGIYDACCATLAELIQLKGSCSNLNVTINSTFTSKNQDELKGLIDHFTGSYDIDGFYVSLIRGNVKDPTTRTLDLSKYREVIKHREHVDLIKKYYDNFALAPLKRTFEFLTPELVTETVQRGKTVFPCTAGRNLVVIGEDGTVSPCEMLSKNFGNLRDYDYDIKTLLKTNQSQSVLKHIRDRKCACTWECAQINSVLFNWRAYPRYFRKLVSLQMQRLIG